MDPHSNIQSKKTVLQRKSNSYFPFISFACIKWICTAVPEACIIFNIYFSGLGYLNNMEMPIITRLMSSQREETFLVLLIVVYLAYRAVPET